MVRCFRDICLVCCVVFLVSEVEMLFGLVPFKTCPFFGLLFVVLSFFLRLLGCSSTPFLFFLFLFLFLSLSLSLRCWGTTNPCGVCVSPSVSSSWMRTPTSTRTSSSSPSPRLRPAPVFFFFSPSLVFWWWLFLGCGGCFRPLLLGGSGALCVLADTCDKAGVAYQMAPQL